MTMSSTPNGMQSVDGAGQTVVGQVGSSEGAEEAEYQARLNAIINQARIAYQQLLQAIQDDLAARVQASQEEVASWNEGLANRRADNERSRRQYAEALAALERQVDAQIAAMEAGLTRGATMAENPFATGQAGSGPPPPYVQPAPFAAGSTGVPNPFIT